MLTSRVYATTPSCIISGNHSAFRRSGTNVRCALIFTQTRNYANCSFNIFRDENTLWGKYRKLNLLALSKHTLRACFVCKRLNKHRLCFPPCIFQMQQYIFPAQRFVFLAARAPFLCAVIVGCFQFCCCLFCEDTKSVTFGTAAYYTFPSLVSDVSRSRPEACVCGRLKGSRRWLQYEVEIAISDTKRFQLHCGHCAQIQFIQLLQTCINSSAQNI